MYTVYVLHSPTYNKIYVGYTSDLQSRMQSHNELDHKGWTRKFRPWTLIHTETFTLKSDALAREKQLKGGQGRAWIRKELIP